MRLQPLQGCARDPRDLFFSPVLIIGIYKRKKKKDLEYEKDEGGKTAALSLISSPLCLCKSAANAEKSI